MRWLFAIVLISSGCVANAAFGQYPVRFPYAAYEPTTGELTLNNLTQVYTIGFADLGGLGTNPANAAVFERGFVDTGIPGEIAWLLFTRLTGNGFNLGAIATPGLSDGLENYFIGIDFGDSTFTLPIPIYSPSGAYMGRRKDLRLVPCPVRSRYGRRQD